MAHRLTPMQIAVRDYLRAAETDLSAAEIGRAVVFDGRPLGYRRARSVLRQLEHLGAVHRPARWHVGEARDDA